MQKKNLTSVDWFCLTETIKASKMINDLKITLALSGDRFSHVAVMKAMYTVLFVLILFLNALKLGGSNRLQSQLEIETKDSYQEFCLACKQAYKEKLEQMFDDDNLWPPQLLDDSDTIDKLCNLWNQTYKDCFRHCRLRKLGINYLCNNRDRIVNATECVHSMENRDQCLLCQNKRTFQPDGKECNCTQCKCGHMRFCSVISCIFQPGRCLSNCTNNEQAALYNYYSTIVEEIFLYFYTYATDLFPKECHSFLRFNFRQSQKKAENEICEVYYNNSDKEPIFSKKSQSSKEIRTVWATCECILNSTAAGLRKKLNVECIQYCYLPCTQRNTNRTPDQGGRQNGSIVKMKHNYYGCNLKKCQDQIGALTREAINMRNFHENFCLTCKQSYNEKLEQIFNDGNLWPPQLLVDTGTIDKVCNFLNQTYKICFPRCGLKKLGFRKLGVNYHCNNRDRMVNATECVLSMANRDQCLLCQNKRTFLPDGKECNCTQCKCGYKRFCSVISCIFEPGRCVSNCTKNEQAALFNYYSTFVEEILYLYGNTTDLFPKECHSFLRFHFQTESKKAENEICEVNYDNADKEPQFSDKSQSSKENHTMSVTCECISNSTAPGLWNKLNLECIQYCYLPCTQRNTYRRPDQWGGQHGYIVKMKANYYGCNLNKCQDQIGESLFNPSTTISDWLNIDIDHTVRYYELSLTSLGASQLSLFSNAHFTITAPFYIIPNKTAARKLEGSELFNYQLTISHSTLTRLRSYRPVVYKREISLRSAIRQGNPSLSYDFPSFYLPTLDGLVNHTTPWGLVLLFDIGGRIVHLQEYFPNILKQIHPPTPPSVPLPRVLQVITYGDVSAEIKFRWEDPFEWNGMPVKYDVECYVTEPNNALFGNYETVDQWWTNINSNALYVHQSTVYWRSRTISFVYKTQEPIEYLNLTFSCRVRAYNANGAGPWSTRISRTYTETSKIIENSLAVVEKFDKKRNTWHYGSTLGVWETTFRKLHTGNRVLISRRHNETKYLSIRENFLPVGCYDWIADQWYIAINRAATKSVWLAVIIMDTEPVQIDYLVELAEQEPLEMCFNPETSTLYLTIKSLGKIKVMNMNTMGIDRKLEAIESQCYKCDHIFDDVVSPAITCIGNALLLHTSSGIWYASVNDCVCYKTLENTYLGNDTVLTLPLYGHFISKFLDQFQNIFYYILTKAGRVDLVFWVSTSDNYLIDIGTKNLHRLFSNATGNLSEFSIPPNSGTNTLETFGIIKQMIEHVDFADVSDMVDTQQDELENLSYYPSHKKTYDNNNTVRTHIWAFHEYRPPLLRNCVFPGVAFVSAEMQSSQVAAILIELNWSDNDVCSGMSKPKIHYELMYGALNKVHKEDIQADNNESCYSKKCPCYTKFTCVKWSSGPTADRQKTTVIIDDIESDTWIYVEITPQPLLGNYRELWYGNLQPLTYKTLFSSKYVEPKTILLRWLLSTLLPLSFTLICLIVAFYYFYTIKGYVYQRIQRLTKSQIDIPEIGNLGTGYFGTVSKAVIRYSGKYLCWMYLPCFSDNKTLPAAVKTLKENSTVRDEKSFLEEAILLSKLESNYIIKTLGICMDTRPIMLALELVNNGSLKQYLGKREVQQAMLTPDLFQIAIDICNGCSYLEQNGIVHRDISAKNCLVNSKANSLRPEIVKLADFGLAKDTRDTNFEYKERTTDFPLPVGFTAPEGFGGIFTSKSDVWSFGVVLWEIFTWGAVPFGTCLVHPSGDPECPVHPLIWSEIHHLVCVEKRSLRNWCPPCLANFRQNDYVYNIQDLCWRRNANKRPNFHILLRNLKDAKSHGSAFDLMKLPPPVEEQNLNDAQLRPQFLEGSDARQISSQSYLDMEDANILNLPSRSSVSPIIQRENAEEFELI